MNRSLFDPTRSDPTRPEWGGGHHMHAIGLVLAGQQLMLMAHSFGGHRHRCHIWKDQPVSEAHNDVVPRKPIQRSGHHGHGDATKYHKRQPWQVGLRDSFLGGSDMGGSDTDLMGSSGWGYGWGYGWGCG